MTNVYLVDGLKANLIRIIQLCDEGLNVIFTKVDCKALDERGDIKLQGIRSWNNCYMWNASNQCLVTVKSQLDIWHRKLGHMSTHGLSKIVNTGVVRGIPKLETSTELDCETCCKGKQVKVQHKQLSDIRTTRIIELVHMDLMGPVQTESISGKRYILVLVDDFSRYTWVMFLRNKSDAFVSFKILALQLKSENEGICQIRSDHGGEFQMQRLTNSVTSKGLGISIQLHTHPNKTVWLKGKIELYKRWPEPCCMGTTFPQGFGQRL